MDRKEFSWRSPDLRIPKGIGFPIAQPKEALTTFESVEDVWQSIFGSRLLAKLRAETRHALLLMLNTGARQPIHLPNSPKKGNCPNAVPWCPLCPFWREVGNRSWIAAGDSQKISRS